jgi:YD repeat-containing protein
MKLFRIILFVASILIINGTFAQSTNTYEYDNLNRLTKVTYANGAVVQYQYDNVGNRTKKMVEGAYTQYTITATANPTAGGTISGAGTFNEGSNCTLIATPNTGYTFVRWTKNGSQVSTNASYSFTVTENATYVAVFSLNSYAITVSANPSAGGTVTGGGTYNHGSNCTLIATPNTGYTFVRWMKNGSQVSTNASYSFTVTENATYVAVFSLNSYAITVSANPSAGGTVTGGGTYNHGSNCTLIATPNTGYVFTNWTENGTEVSTDATYSFVVTGNRTLVANFTITQTEFHWTPNDSQYANTMTAIAIIQIDGVEQRTTALELGAFCGNECRGRQLLVYYSQVDRYLLFLDIYGNDGDALNFRLYDHVTGQESNLPCSTSETFVSNASLGSVASPYVFNFTNAITQTTAMPLGWSWWSPAVEVEGEDGLMQLEESLGDNGLMIKSRLNGFVSNYGGMWMGSLNSISSEQTYLIQTAAACEMSLTGSAPLPASHAISLAPGWNWIGYPLGESMSVATAMSGITPTENDMLKSRDNGFTIYYPGFGWMGSLSTLVPGMGLMYESHNSQTITLTYPGTAKSETLKQNIMARGDHWMPVAYPYPNNMTVLSVVEMDGVELHSDRYELGVFADDECRGSAKLVYEPALNRYVAYLTVYGEDPMPLRFGLYDAETGVERFDVETELTYVSNAVQGNPTAPYVVRFREVTGLDEQGIRASVFPNPVDRGQTLLIGLEASKGNPIRVEVLNELGATVSLTKSEEAPVRIKAPETAGIYLLRITVEGKGGCYRKLVVR